MSNGKEISLLKRTASGVFVREVAETLVKGKIIFSGGALIFVRLFVSSGFTVSMVVGANSLLLISVAECNSETKSLTVLPPAPFFFLSLRIWRNRLCNLYVKPRINHCIRLHF